MNTVCRSAIALLVAAGLSTSLALAQPASKEKPKAPEAKPAAAAQPGQGGPEMTAEEQAMMEAMMKAAAPGEMHERLAKAAGTWQGKMKMWHAPGAPAEESECTSVMSPMFGGRYLKNETKGDMGEFGLFEGFGLYGFDNVSGQFQSIWIDNMGTGMITGTGELSEDGKTLTWNMEYNCPITHQKTWMREVERHLGENEMVLEMYGPDPEGNEFKMMEIHYTRTAKHAATTSR